jgi:cyclic pyranopterin phosphate synthase
MTTADVTRVLEVAQAAGIQKVKITGGEPLIRSDIIEIVRVASELFDEVSMTTNGVLLSSCADELAKAGMNRINVSLDTLDRAVYEHITGTDQVHAVVDGIDSAFHAGLVPIKINTVLLNGLNETHLPQLTHFAASRGVTLQLIELNPVGGNCGDALRQFFHSLAEIESSFAAQSIRVESNELHDRKRYVIPFNGTVAKVEIVRSLGRGSFCMNCTRIRVTSDGMLKPCLMTGEGTVDFLSRARSGASDNDLLKLLEGVVINRKPYWVAE